MSEGKITFSATHAPAGWDDPLTHVLISAHIRQVGGFGAISVEQEILPDEALRFAEQIIQACNIVRDER